MTTTVLGAMQTLTATLHVAKIGHRQFTATVRYAASPNGWLTSDVCGKRTTARKNLEAKLLAAGVPIPKWSIKDHGTVERKAAPAPQPEPKQAPAPAPEVDDEAPTLRQVSSVVRDETPEETDYRQAKKAAFQGIAFPVAPRMEGGYVTPLSDKDAWLDVYRQARAKFDAVQFEEGETRESRSEKIREYRTQINTLMESISFIGPWRRTVGGDFWIRFSGEADHTVRGATHRSRRQVTKNINGNWVQVENGKARSLTRDEKREANRAAYREQRKAERAAKGASYTGSTEHRNIAYKYASAMSRSAKEAGHDSATQRLWYKVGYVVSLRSMNALPHTKFEDDLKAAGITEEYLQGQVAEYKGSEAKAAA